MWPLLVFQDGWLSATFSRNFPLFWRPNVFRFWLTETFLRHRFAIWPSHMVIRWHLLFADAGDARLENRKRSKVLAMPQINIRWLDNMRLFSNHLTIASPTFPPLPGLKLNKSRAISRPLPNVRPLAICPRYFAFCATNTVRALVCRHTFGSAAQNPQPPSAIANAGSFIPRFFKSVKQLYQLSVLSRNPSRIAKRCFLPKISTPIITNRHLFSSAIPAWT